MAETKAHRGLNRVNSAAKDTNNVREVYTSNAHPNDHGGGSILLDDRGKPASLLGAGLGAVQFEPTSGTARPNVSTPCPLVPQPSRLVPDGLTRSHN